MSLRSQVLSGLFWTGGARLLSQVLTWAITIIVVRLLSPDDYGLLAMATVFMSLLALLAEAGLGAALVQAPEVDELKLRRIFGAVILIDVTLFLVQVAAAPAIAYFFAEERLVPIIRVLAIQFLLMIVSVIPLALLSRRLDFKRQSMIDLAGAVCGSLSTLGLVLAGYGVWALVIGNLVSTAIKSLAINAVAPFLEWPEFSVTDLRGVFTYGGQVTAARVLSFAYSQADILIAGKLLGKELLGFYSVSMHLASLPVQKVSSILNQVAFPAFAKAQHETNQTASYLLKAVRILSFVAFPVLWGMSSVSIELVLVLLGPKWDLAIVPIQILTLVMPLRMISMIVSTAIDGIGRPDISVKNLIVGNVIMLPAFAIGSTWGLTGLCIAWGCVSPLVVLLNWLRSLPAVNMGTTHLLRVMALPALCSCAMYGAVVLARRHLIFGQTSLFQLLTLVLVGMVTYALLSAAFNMKVCKEIIELRNR